ncbi:multidrug resistance protein 1B-like [Spodoptera litura]|uniref:ABC-type xenobiotic transporter n=1 Tax=Spodoptera litura TaxID=69820 RepID=A0A9J7DMK2_SPOLT|nr:multidrug resistance protein 1B-like [Spodoptera litura]
MVFQYRFSTKLDKFLISISILASLVAGVTLPYAITLVANVFQNMITYDKAVQAGTQDDEVFLSQMHEFGVTYSCVGVLLFICVYLGSALMNVTAINQVFKIREEYLTAALNQDFAYFDKNQTGDFASKMADDVIKLEEGIGDKVSSFTYSLTTAIGCIVMAMLKGWKLALLCLTTAPVTFILVGITGRIADRLYKKEAAETGRASSIAQEVLSSIRTVYSFNGQKKELERYKKPLAAAKKVYIQKEFFTGLSMAFLFFCIFCSYALSFYFGIYLVVNDPENYNADVMFSVFFGVMTALGNFGMVGSLVRSFGLARGAGAQIFNLLQNVPTINPLLDRGFKPHTAEGTIELKNVVFQYPSRPDVPVLKGVSLTVKRGQSVALVGHSGSGKSTIIQLISRYYDVVSGSVCVDNIDVRELSVRWLRSQIGLVRQEPVLFNNTVRENIRYGCEDATDAEIQAAAEQANAHFFIIKLPKGYDTLVGERGASLSGGQKQRIAIARALVRKPRLLLLDEATSALDTASEAKVQLALDKAAEGRTTLVVAHRLSTIRHVGLIYVFQDGEVVESGTHEELMANKGHYYEMVSIQEPDNLAAREEQTVLREESGASEASKEEQMVEPLEEDDSDKLPHISFWRVLAMKSQEWKWLLTGTVCSIVIGFSMPLFILVFGDLFGSMSESDPNKLMDKVKKVSTICILIGILMGTSNLIEAISFGIAGAHLTERLRTQMFEHLLQQHIGFFDERRNSTGALCAKLSAEAAYVQGATGQRIGTCLQGIGSVGLALVLAMLFEYRLGLVALCFLPLIIFVVVQQIKATRRESYGNAKALESSTKIAIEAVSNVRTVVCLGRERMFVREYVKQLAPALADAKRAAHCRGLVNGLSRSIFNFINAASLTYGGHLIVSEGVAYKNILITTQSLQMASGQAQNAFTFTPEFEKGVSAATRITVLLESKPEISDPATPLVSPFKSKGEASLEAVHFRYPTRPGVHVLRGLDLQIKRGKTIALVGRSGCGKSTVIQLLQRYYDPDSGAVCLDGIPLSGLTMSDARACFGLVSQEPVLFDYSIEENIAYGDYMRSPTHQEVIDAAKQANIHNFIISLPQGYDTNIGAKGMQLSGGQKQRVAIARALIRHPQILLLDEATSALDTESEKVVQEALDAATAGRTCITIAHRLSTIRDADLICVVNKGRVAEAGTHQQLLDLKGLYYDLHVNAK